MLLLLILINRPLRMLSMKMVFKAFDVPHDKQVEWVLKEARRNDRLALARGFWNRAAQRRPKTNARLKRVPAPRRAEVLPVVELSGDAREARSPVA